MAKSKYGVGAVSVTSINAEVGVTDINPRRTLLVIPLQLEGPIEPKVLPDEYTKSLKGVFAYAKPQIKVDLDTGDDENPTVSSTIKFEELSDFKPESIIKKNKTLQSFATKEKVIEDTMGHIKNSKAFKTLVSNTESKEELITTLESLLEKLK